VPEVGVSSAMHHRAGLLKQSNKSHATLGHKSKRSVDNVNRGRVGLKDLPGRRNKSLESRQERRHKSKQVRDVKKSAVLDAKRNLGNFRSPPLLTAVVPLFDASADCVDKVIKSMTECDEAAATVTCSQSGTVHLAFPRFKKRFAFIAPDRNNLMAVLDAAKVCDSVLFLVSTSGAGCLAENGGMDFIGDRLLSAVLVQGLPIAPTFVQAPTPAEDEDAMDMGSSSSSVKKRNEAKKSMLKSLERKCGSVEKLFSLDKSDNQDGLLLLRHLSAQKRRQNSLRAHRPHLVAESVDFVGEGSTGTVKVQGYVRCANPHYKLSVNRLIHVPGWGEFQLAQIDGLTDPHPLVSDKKKLEKKQQKNSANGDVEMDKENGAAGTDEQDVQVLAVPDEERLESLVTENEPDGMDAEQTWPTEEELLEAEKEQREKSKRVVKVPKGTSEYQAAWIVDHAENDDDESGDDDDEEDDEEDDDMEEEGTKNLDAVSQEGSDEEDDGEEEEEEEYDTITVTEGGNDDAANYDEKHMNLMEEQEALKKMQAAKMDAMFPDEVDTPIDMPAKVRFQKYRGLKSFRSSPWDPKENLPFDYARIFQFENFLRTRKRVFGDLKAEAEDNEEEGAAASAAGGVEVGTYVCLHLKEVPRHLYNDWRQTTTGVPLVLFSMLPHEQKMCVLNFAIKRHPDAMDDVIKSKERLIFHVGYRRFAAQPVFSQHTNGEKHKYLRYWQPEEVIVMTTFAPIMFPPANVLVYREMSSGRHQLVGTGSLLSADPDRLIVKRTVLSGHPFKVHTKMATVRFMFFNRADIDWFKPVELRTKRGRRGHIKEPLGTHGHMKVMFDGPLSQQDTVLMNLYKRVFPKWTYDPFVTEHKSAAAAKISMPATASSSTSVGFLAPDTLQLTRKKKESTAVSATDEDEAME